MKTDNNGAHNNNKFEILILILLIIILILGICHYIKLSEIAIHSKFANNKLYSESIRSKRNEMKSEFEKIKDEIHRKEIAKRQNKNRIQDNTQKTTQNDQFYILEIEVPEGVKSNDISFKLENNILGVAFSGIMEISQNKKLEAEDAFSVYRFFELPKTKATLNDIKYEVNNGILTVIVPILK